MSDPKRATPITVGAAKSDKSKVNKTVRLTINLDESNESKYPELNYKELVIAEVKKKTVENGKTAGLNPFSDNDEDVERVARKFEQKYGGKSTYGRKTKADDFADIGAGYDENDSFIDNTDGYDEMIPPECETLYGGFYINSGLLEFKNADNVAPISDGEPGSIRRNKRRISSSSSEDDSSESSSDTDSGDEKDPKAIANGAVDTHKTEHRKKKNKKIEKKPKKVRRTDSSAATSGKQTSDDNAPESADSRTSQSDSLTSKPAPSSENAITSDSSRDVEARELLPDAVSQVLDELEAAVTGQLIENPRTMASELDVITDPFMTRLESTLSENKASPNVCRTAWSRAAKAVNMSRSKLMQRVKALTNKANSCNASETTTATNATGNAAPNTAQLANKRKLEDVTFTDDLTTLTDEERETKIVEALEMLKVLIEERKPGMIANYKAECERVQEDRRKLQIASSCDGSRPVDRRMPKRRFPWCGRSRALLARLKALAGSDHAAAALLATRALPLFPVGFVRMPAILKQANLSKEIKMSDIKRQRLGSASQPQPPLQPMTFTEAIQFPSSLTVTTTPAIKPQKPEKTETATTTEKDKNKTPSNPISVFGNIINSFSISKDLIVVEKTEEKRKESVIVEKQKDEYVPQSNIGSVTITPVQSNTNKNEKKVNNVEHKEPLIRVKSPAALNEMAQKREKEKALENMHKDRDKYKNPEKPVEKVSKIEKQNDKQPSSNDKQNLPSDKVQHNDKNRLPSDKYHSSGDKVHSSHERHHSSERKSDKVQSSGDHKYHTNERQYATGEKGKTTSEKHQNDRHHTSEKGHSINDKQHHSNERRHHSNEKHHSSEKHYHAIEKQHLNEKQYHSSEKHHNSSDKHHSSSSEKHQQNEKHQHLNEKHHTVEKQVYDKPHNLTEKQQSIVKEKRVSSPLHVDISYQPKQKDPSPKNKIEKISNKQIENMRVQENNIPRPALIPVHLSPTFIKPSKPPETKKKKDLVIVSDLDPLGDIQSEPLAIDDSSSDVELVEDTKSDRVSDKSDSVPSNKVSVNHKEVRESKDSKDVVSELDDAMKEDFNSVMKGLKDLESSQEPKLSSNSFGGVITSAKRDACGGPLGRGSIFAEARSKDKFAERTSLNKMDGCNGVNG